MVKTNSAAPLVARSRRKSAVEWAWQRVAIAFVAFASLLIANEGRAGSGKSVNVVLMVEGTDTDAVRRDVTAALPPRFTMVDADATRAALSKEGVMGSFADSLSNQRLRKNALSAVHKSLNQQGVPALIAARMRRGRNNARELRIVLVMSEQVEPVVEEDITLGRNEKVGTKIGPLLAVPLEDIEASNEKAVAAAGKGAADKPAKGTRAGAATEPPPPPPPPPKDEPPPPAAAPAPVVAAASTDDTTRDSGPKKKHDKTDFSNGLLIVDAGLDVGSRKFSYSDPLVGPLRSYVAPGVIGYAFAGELYPGASTGTAFVKDIGIVGRYAGSFPFSSQTRDGSQEASGSFTRSAFGVRGRILAGPKTSGPYIGLEGTYGTWAFVFEGSSPIVAEVPSVTYKYLRGAIDARFPFGAFSLKPALGGMYVLSAGEFTDRFPHSSIFGVDVGLTAAYTFLPWLEAKADASYTRIFSTANPQAGDAYVAGGALDEYFIFHGGVAAVF
jgi:hypothetical protein